MKKVLISVFALMAVLTMSAAPKAEDIVLENSHIKAVFDGKSGALVRLDDKNSGWNIMERRILGQSFEILLPMEGKEMTDEDKRFNVVKGIEQKDPVIERTSDGVIFTWSGLKTEFMKETADITFRGEVILTDKGLEFKGHVDNRSKHHIEYVSWPFIGEITVPDKSKPLYHCSGKDRRELFPHMFNQHGYWGVDYPTSTYILPEKSYLQVNGDDRGFMVYNNKFPKYTTITSFELIPGYEIRGVNPYGDEMDGELVRLQFKVNNCVYTLPGESADIDPVSFVTYSGSWENGVDIYRKDRKSYGSDAIAYKEKSTADWMKKPLTWKKAGIGNGADLIRHAEECAALGVDVLVVYGWTRNSSGHVAEVDGMEKAIERCHELGLKVVLETCWTRVDRHGEGYMDNLRGYVMSDPFDMPYRFDFMCPNAPYIQDLVKKEWLSLPALKAADGYMNNDHNHESKTFMCFDTDHGHRFGEPTITGMMDIDSYMAEAIASDPEKVALGMGFLEYENDIYDGAQVGVGERDYARARFTSPYEPMILKVRTRSARKDLNKSLLYSFIPAYELNFHGSFLADYPNIYKYGQKIEEIRNKYASYIWDAEFVYHEGASVSGNDIEWSVFRGKDGKRAVVAVNNSTDNESEVSVKIDGNKGLVWASPEKVSLSTFNGTMKLAPQSAVVIMEK